MAQIRSYSNHPIRHINAGHTHLPVKLQGAHFPFAAKPAAEHPDATSKRTTAGREARLARAFKNNRHLHLTR